MSGFDLGDFLEKARAEGRSDSEGSFTISQAKALEKLARFALPGEYDWVLKIIQAANAWRAPLIDIRQTRVATSIYFRPVVIPEGSELITALRQGRLGTQEPMHELCMALRALVDQAELSFVLALCSDGIQGEPIYFGDDISSVSDRLRREWATLQQDGLRLTVSHFKGKESFGGRYLPTAFKVPRRDLEIAGALKTRAFASPTPILLDGRDITNPYQSEVLLGGPEFRFLALGRMRENDLQWWPIGAFEDHESLLKPDWLNGHRAPWCVVRSFEPWAYQEYRAALGDSRRVVTISFDLGDRHRVYWLRHGVVCKTEELANDSVATALFSFCHLDDAGTDLTGLALSDETVRPPILARLESSLPSLVEQIPSLAAAKVPLSPRTAPKQDIDSGIGPAGYSIFTTSLEWDDKSIRRSYHRLKRNWRTFLASFRGETLLKAWANFLPKDLRTVRNDFKRALVEEIPPS